ncbi:uncharacterized protein LOC122260333 [Penaeus japonicus]|uniref:uncharacterized protein LOC122260333 n=1 Tax=Penaeus japonicus TaxID=27405 RepID=UPI001C70E478|nr:uncharacterized protein LOC122260333 [Penaeus japonicus]
MLSGTTRVIAATALVLAVSAAWTEGQFADTPKHVPRFGRRSDLPALEEQLAQQKRGERRAAGGVAGGVAGALVRVDGDGDGCINMDELLRIPVVRAAVLLQNPALISEESAARPIDTTGDAYEMDHLRDSNMHRLLQI